MGGGGGGGGEWPMRGLGTGHVISGQMRGLKKNGKGRGQPTDRHTDIATTRLYRPGADAVEIKMGSLGGKDLLYC